jgi:hypothetical protein
MRMGTGRSEEIDLAKYLPPAPPAPAMPSSLRTAARRPADGDRALVLDAGDENVIVVLGEDAGDAGAIWSFIRQRMTGQNTGLM